MLAYPLLAVLLAVVILVACIIAINARYRRTKHYKLRTAQLQKYIDGVPNQLLIANLGSAHAREAFAYHSVGLRSFNFALKSQPLLYDLIIMNKFKDRFASGAVVLISIEPLLFAVEHYSGLNNRMYYYFLSREEIIGYRSYVAIQEKNSPRFYIKASFIVGDYRSPFE